MGGSLGSIQDGEGFDWSFPSGSTAAGIVDAATDGGGNIEEGLASGFGAFQLGIAQDGTGAHFQDDDPGTVLSTPAHRSIVLFGNDGYAETNNTVTFDAQTLRNITVDRTFFAPTTAGEGYIRLHDTFTNNTGASQTFLIFYRASYNNGTGDSDGIEANYFELATSSGDSTTNADAPAIDTSDSWYIIDEGTAPPGTQDDPPLLHLYGDGTISPVYAERTIPAGTSGPNKVSTDLFFRITLDPGETIGFLSFVAQTSSFGAAGATDLQNDDVAQLSALTASDAALAGLSQTEIDQLANFTVAASNTAPALGGTPGDVLANEDVTTPVDLSAYNVNDPDGDTLTLTLAVDRGTIASTDGNGLFSGVTVATSGSNSMTLQGSAAALNTYLNVSPSKIQFTTAANDAATATLTVTPNDGTTNGTADTVAMFVVPVNDAPVLDNTATPTLTSITEDAGDDDGSGADGDDDATNNANNPGTTVAAIVTDGSITDPDTGAAPEAIAVVSVGNTNGLWQYSTDNGTTWAAFTSTTGAGIDISSTARLLDGSLTGAQTNLVRFVPDADFNGTATIEYRAWDKSSGVVGATADATTHGGTSAFSSTSELARITITGVNDAPFITSQPADLTFFEDTLGNVDLSGLSITDTDSASVTLTLQLSGVPSTSGSFAAPASGAANSVTATLVNAQTITLVGAPASIEAYLGTASNIRYQGPLNVNGDNVQTIGYTINDGDGSGNIASGSTNIDITAVDDPAVAQDDAFTVAENGTLGLSNNVLVANPTTADADVDSALSVTQVHGSGASVGSQITLQSGALLTLNADGTFAYDPNGAFAFLPQGVGGTDTFTYELNGDDTATVTITITGIDGDDTFLATNVVDTFDGGVGFNTISYGNTGPVLFDLANPGANTEAAAGDTTSNILGITGSNGNDTLSGDGGDNVIEGGAGDDIIDGRAGTDTASYSAAPGGVTVSLFATGAQNTGTAGTDTLTDIQNLRGSAFNDTFLGGNDDNVLSGGMGDDTLRGRFGDDTLNGGAGEDTLVGRHHNNTLVGGEGDDIYHVKENDTVIEAVGEGYDRVNTYSDFALDAGAEVEFLFDNGGAGHALSGNEFDNKIYGMSGADTLNGGGGDDLIKGGTEGDTINGGDGRDMMFGEGGADTFLFTAVTDSDVAAAGRDFIRDWSGSTGEGDLLDVSAFASTFIGTGSFSGAAGEVRYANINGNTHVYADEDGDGARDFMLTITGTHILAEADFILV